MKKAIVVLGGGLIKKGATWKTIDLGEGGDDFAASNDRWRVLATARLWYANSNLFIVASGGKGQLEGILDVPTIAEVIKDELRELGVPEHAIIKEEGSGSTIKQLKSIPVLAKENSFEEISILSNEWHLPRIKMMFEMYPGLKESFDGLSVDFVSAEDILVKNDPGWISRVLSARIDPAMQKRYELERKGTDQMKNGTYKFRDE